MYNMHETVNLNTFPIVMAALLYNTSSYLFSSESNIHPPPKRILKDSSNSLLNLKSNVRFSFNSLYFLCHRSKSG